MATVSVRYMVHDVDAAIAFYTGHLGFTVALHPSPGFAMFSRGNLRLLLNTPTGSGGAAQAMPDGRKPEPRGWNRILLEVEDLARAVETLRSAGARLRVIAERHGFAAALRALGGVGGHVGPPHVDR